MWPMGLVFNTQTSKGLKLAQITSVLFPSTGKDSNVGATAIATISERSHTEPGQFRGANLSTLRRLIMPANAERANLISKVGSS